MVRKNGISIDDVLKLEVMGDSKLVAGFKAIKNTVTSINMVADPDIFDWVQDGEFLLTTAYSFRKENIESIKGLIRKSNQNNLSGMGIKVYPYLDSLPEEVLKYADELNFPIIDIHHSIPLSDIMMAISKEIFNKQTSLLERMEKVHERLMEIMIEGKSIEDVIELVSKNIRNPVILRLGMSNKTYNQFDKVRNSTKEQLVIDANAFYDAKDGRSRIKKLHEEKVLISGKYVNRMVMPIVLKDEIYGHLFSWSINSPLAGFDLSILESASTTVALFVLQDLSVKEVEIKHRTEFFEELISQDLNKKEKAMERAHFYNLDLNSHYVVELVNFKLKTTNKKDTDHYFEYMKDYANMVVMNIEEIIEYHKLNCIVSNKLDGIQILLEFKDKENISRKIKQINESVISSLNERFNSISIRIGVGRTYKGLDRVIKSYSDALKAINTSEVLTDKNVVTFEELGIYKILCQDYMADELEEFYNTTLKCLVDYDKKKSTELVKTLEAYFECNGNLAKMSEYLFTHYNTILYRVKRIEEITNMELCNYNDRLNLEIAMKIKRLL
ncbi:MAG: PucR family transcriptional regulator [Tissierellia bacterium]|nr:PucR family transcriptional regulator [Tissierellia bacterium]